MPKYGVMVSTMSGNPKFIRPKYQQEIGVSDIREPGR
jgi:hypothetical protein